MIFFKDVFDFYKKEFGSEITINDETVQYTAYIQDISLKSTFFNDKIIYTENDIKTGDVIGYDNEKWIIYTQIDNFGEYNVATMRQADFVTKFVFYGTVYESPCIYMNQSITSSANQVSLTDSKTVCVIPHYPWVDNIKVEDKFVQFGYFWNVTGFDFTKDGLVYVHAERGDEADMLSNQLGYDSSEILYDWIIKWNILPSTIIAGQSYPIQAQLIKIYDNGYTEPATEPFYYDTDNSEIAVISDNELVAKKAGTVKIIATFSKDFTKKIEREVDIYPTNDNYTLKFDEFPDSMFTEDKLTINAKVYKNGVFDDSAVVKYFIPTNYSNIAEIDETHKITALSTGTFVVYAQYETLYQTLVITKSVNVLQSVYSLQFDTQTRLFKLGTQRECVAKVYRNNVVDMSKPVAYESSNVEVASIDNSGNISAETLGSAVITAYLLGNRDVKISKPIEVVEDAYEVIWDKYLSGRLYLDKTYSCHAYITKNYEPLPVTEPLELGYFSSDDRVVSVDDSGNVTVNGVGKATITAYIKTMDSIKATSDVYVDQAVFEIKIVNKATNTEDYFNEKHLYWTSDTKKEKINKDLWDSIGVGIWRGFNVVITRDGEPISSQYLARDCVKITVNDVDITTAWFNEADILHNDDVIISDGVVEKYDYLKHRKRYNSTLNELSIDSWYTNLPFYKYKIEVFIPDHEEVEHQFLEWSFIFIPTELSNIAYGDDVSTASWSHNPSLRYPVYNRSSVNTVSKIAISPNTVNRVEIDQMQLADDNVTFAFIDILDAMLKRDTEKSWRYSELNRQGTNNEKCYNGIKYYTDKQSMLINDNYYGADIEYEYTDAFKAYVRYRGGIMQKKPVPEYINNWLKSYRQYLPYCNVYTNDDTVIGAEYTPNHWNYLKGIGIGSAVITTEYGVLTETNITQDITRFQNTANCVRTTGLGLYLTSNKYIPCRRMMGIRAYATLNSQELSSDDIVFEIYDDGGNDIELHKVPKINRGSLLDNGVPRRIKFTDGWREDEKYAERNPYYDTEVINSSAYVDIDNFGNIVYDNSMRFIYIKNEVPVGDIYIKAYNRDYPNNYVVRRLYVTEYLSPVGRLTSWIGFKTDTSDDLPRVGIGQLELNFDNLRTDYINNNSIIYDTTKESLSCTTYKTWKKQVTETMAKYKFPEQYRYMSIFLYDKSQPNNIIRPEDKYDIGFWRWGFDYNGYGGYATYTGDGIGAILYNNQIIVDLKSWQLYLQTYAPFYILLQNYAMGVDSFSASLSTYNYMDDSKFDYSIPTDNFVLGQATRSEVIKNGFEGTIEEAMKNLAISKAYADYEKKYSTTGEDAYRWSNVGYTKLWYQNLPEPTYFYLMIINNSPTPFNLNQWYLSLYADWFNKKNGEEYDKYYGAGRVLDETFDYDREYNGALDIVYNAKFPIDVSNSVNHAYNRYFATEFALQYAKEVVGIENGYIYAPDTSIDLT